MGRGETPPPAPHLPQLFLSLEDKAGVLGTDVTRLPAGMPTGEPHQLYFSLIF